MIKQWAKEAGFDVMDDGAINDGIETAADFSGELSAFAALVAAYQRELDAKDAERYRWLRSQVWFDNTLCVVLRPKDSTKLGTFCPSFDLLDGAIDDAILGAKP